MGGTWAGHGEELMSPALPVPPLGQLAQLSPAFAALSQWSQGTELNSGRA